MSALHRRLISFFIAVLVIWSMSAFIDFDFFYLIFICSIVALCIGFLSRKVKDAVFNGFWFGFSISMSCAVWLDEITWRPSSDILLFIFISAFISCFVGGIGLAVALIGNRLKRMKTLEAAI